MPCARVPWSPPVLQARVEAVPQTVSEEVETQHGQGDGDAGIELQAWGDEEQFLTFLEHPAPRRRPGRGAEAEVGQAASARTAIANDTEAWTMTRLPTLGNTWRAAMATGRRPAARAAKTYSVFITPMAPLRTTRANDGIVEMPMAIIAVTTPWPWTAVSMIANSSAGKARSRSLARMTTSPHHLGTIAERMPSGTPTTAATPTETRPTSRVVRDPTMSSETTSRPNLSVPSQCRVDGVASRSAALISPTSNGVQTSEMTARIAMTATIPPPTMRVAPTPRRERRPRGGRRASAPRESRLIGRPSAGEGR